MLHLLPSAPLRLRGRRPRGLSDRLIPRYELRLLGGETGEEPVQVWTRHRFRRLAELSLREERKHLNLRTARLEVHDRRAD